MATATTQVGEKGLMFVKVMPEGRGMIFYLGVCEAECFLDEEHLYSAGYVVHPRWQGGRDYCCGPRPLDESLLDPGVDSDSVLEVNGGWSTRHNVGVGAENCCAAEALGLFGKSFFKDTRREELRHDARFIGCGFYRADRAERRGGRGVRVLGVMAGFCLVQSPRSSINVMIGGRVFAHGWC